LHSAIGVHTAQTVGKHGQVADEGQRGNQNLGFSERKRGPPSR
jgi:hypothetical protein